MFLGFFRSLMVSLLPFNCLLWGRCLHLRHSQKFVSGHLQLTINCLARDMLSLNPEVSEVSVSFHGFMMIYDAQICPNPSNIQTKHLTQNSSTCAPPLLLQRLIWNTALSPSRSRVLVHLKGAPASSTSISQLHQASESLRNGRTRQRKEYAVASVAKASMQCQS